MTSKRDYAHIAGVLRAEYDRLKKVRDNPPESKTDPTIVALASVNAIAHALATQFERDNPRFDRRAFLEAVHGRRK